MLDVRSRALSRRGNYLARVGCQSCVVASTYLVWISCRHIEKNLKKKAVRPSLCSQQHCRIVLPTRKLFRIELSALHLTLIIIHGSGLWSRRSWFFSGFRRVGERLNDIPEYKRSISGTRNFLNNIRLLFKAVS